jgi:CMP-N,N'-diacetyllegionaminic acid synthase
MRILAVITARGGSKGIPRKNLRSFGGKPLIAHTIECARALSEKFCDVIVSTDNPEIADVSRSFGAEVPFMRPAELAYDETASLPVIRHAMEFIERRDAVPVDWVLTLQPTSPLRAVADVAALIDAVADGAPTAAVTVTEVVNGHPLKLRCVEEGWLRAWDRGEISGIRRQDLKPQAYKTNGAGYLTRRDMVFERNTLYGPYVRPVLMPPERSVDIDTEFDFVVAEALLGWLGRSA